MNETEIKPPYRASDPPPRPRLWVPGVAWMTPDPVARIEIGPLAGFVVDDARSIRDWKTEIALVERAGLESALRIADVDAEAILPERVLDRENTPSLHRVALAAEVLAVDQGEWRALLDAGARGYLVGYHRVSDGFGFHAEGGHRPSIDDGGEYGELRDAFVTSLPDNDEQADRVLDALEGPRGLLDRVLRAHTNGRLTEATLMLAHDLRTLTHPSLLARGRNAQPRRTPAEARHAARGWEAEMTQVFERAKRMESDARALVEALRHAEPSADTIEVPTYGTLRRVRVPSARRSGTDPRDDLTLDAEDHWYAERIDGWTPTLPDAIRVEMQAEAQTHIREDASRRHAEQVVATAATRVRKRRARRAWLLVFGVFVALAALIRWLRS